MKSPIAIREVFLDRIMRGLSRNNKDVIEVLINAKNEYKPTRKQPINPIDDSIILYISVYLHRDYEDTKLRICKQITMFNDNFEPNNKG